VGRSLWSVGATVEPAGERPPDTVRARPIGGQWRHTRRSALLARRTLPVGDLLLVKRWAPLLIIGGRPSTMGSQRRYQEQDAPQEAARTTRPHNNEQQLQAHSFGLPGCLAHSLTSRP